MIKFTELTRKTKFVQSDYTFEKSEDMLSMLPHLTPKFKGNWIINLVDPRIKDAFHLIEHDVLPNYIDCYVYMSQSKLDIIVLKHPKLIPTKQKPWETYQLMIAELNHPIDPKAADYIYSTLSGNLDKLHEALSQLDRDCESDTITIQQAKQEYKATRKVVYASDVVKAFFTRDKWRWNKYNNLVQDLGQSYAYYAIRKQVLKWSSDKNDYLQNKEVENWMIGEIDAPFISYVFLLFINSNNPNELHPLMLEWDNRSIESVERRIYADI